MKKGYQSAHPPSRYLQFPFRAAHFSARYYHPFRLQSQLSNLPRFCHPSAFQSSSFRSLSAKEQEKSLTNHSHYLSQSSEGNSLLAIIPPAISPSAFEDPFYIQPEAEHSHTIIALHGRGSQGPEVCRSSTGSKRISQWLTFRLTSIMKINALLVAQWPRSGVVRMGRTTD